ncbi:MAG: tetratricopeptide repeat protein [Lysobacterales bacterium]
MSFFSELKRRNVFRVGIAYAISAWVLLQVADLVLENIGAPPMVMRIFMLALAVGFPIALIFAWAFELTPDGLKLEKDVDRSQSITQVTAQRMNRNIIIALVIAVVLLLVDKFTPDMDTQPEPVAENVENVQAPASEAQPTEKSIAVLPFVDMSPDGDQAYFADGISEEILNVLVKTHSLKVAGRTSSFQFRGRSEDLRTIGEQLGVQNILEGSIRKANNRVRITAQLVTASDGFHLWSETYDRELTDIFAIQDEIARAITDALAIQLSLTSAGETLAPVSTRNMDAYDRYLEARGLIVQRLDFPRAIELLDEAIRMDPQFAEAWAANAQAHTLMRYYLNVSGDEVRAKAEAMALKALAINPNLSAAHSVLGDVYRDNFKWKKAIASYQRALALNPDDIEANEQYAQMLQRVNYFDEALKYSARAVELDPLSWLNLTVHSRLLYASGERSAGWVAMQRVLEMTGRNREYPLRLAINMSISEGNIARATELIRDLSNSTDIGTNAPAAKIRFDQQIPLLNSREDTLAFLKTHMDESFALGVNSLWALDIYLAAYYGDYDLAEEIMKKGILLDEKLGTLDISWLSDPIINPLHNSVTYKAILRKIGLDDFWRENGFPVNCRAVGEDDFVCN